MQRAGITEEEWRAYEDEYERVFAPKYGDGDEKEAAAEGGEGAGEGEEGDEGELPLEVEVA
jgi:hypothetical protein